jgi:hypothetical protein
MKHFTVILVCALLFTVPCGWSRQSSPGPDSPAAAREQGPAASSAEASSAEASSAEGRSAASAKEKSAEEERPDGYIDPNEPLFAPDPLPKGTVSLVGGIVESLDRIRSRVTLKVIAGKKMTVAFDERTAIVRDGKPVTYEKIRPGDRIYADTILNEGQVFARAIRIQTVRGEAEARGQVLVFDSGSGQMSLREELSSQPVVFQVVPETRIVIPEGQGRQASQTARPAQVVPGALVQVKFLPGKDADGRAEEIAILALPGSNVLFAGSITHLDLRLGMLSVANRSDDKIYDLRFDTASADLERLKVGAPVTIAATFTGQGYRARQITIHSASAPE